MNSEQASPRNFTTPPGAGATVELLGTRQVFKADAPGTAGQAVCAEIQVPTGKGIAMHRHLYEDESFYVVEGEVVIEAEDTGIARLNKGSFFYGPRGRPHYFRNEGSQTAELVVFAAPGANIGAMYAELAGLIQQHGPDGVDPAQLAEVSARHGILFTND